MKDKNCILKKKEYFKEIFDLRKKLNEIFNQANKYKILEILDNKCNELKIDSIKKDFLYDAKISINYLDDFFYSSDKNTLQKVDFNIYLQKKK